MDVPDKEQSPLIWLLSNSAAIKQVSLHSISNERKPTLNPCSKNAKFKKCSSSSMWQRHRIQKIIEICFVHTHNRANQRKSATTQQCSTRSTAPLWEQPTQPVIKNIKITQNLINVYNKYNYTKSCLMPGMAGRDTQTWLVTAIRQRSAMLVWTGKPIQPSKHTNLYA